jgi:UDP-2,3-diacylglucosamine hydrolase
LKIAQSPSVAALPSAFLPATFDARRPVALIAGQGVYPILIAKAVRAAGIPLKLVAFEEETRPELFASFAAADRRMFKVGQLGHMLDALRDYGAGYALMAGQITPRRLFKGLHPDLKATRILFSLKRRNAETIFGAIAREIEDLGITLLDARAFLDDQLATIGCMTGRKFPIEQDYVNHGVQIARECARLDIGQGCVVRKGTVLAVEAFEGTDEMLRRAGGFKTDEALFVKTVKARQDWRFDVPCFGLRTLETMREAQLKAAALDAGKVIILEKPAVIEQARTWGISLMGFG